MLHTAQAVRRQACAPTSQGLKRRGIDADAIDLPRQEGGGRRAAIPRGSCQTGPAPTASRSRSAASRTAAGSPASPPPSRRHGLRRLVLFSYPAPSRPAAGAAPRPPHEATGRRSAAPSCCCPARPTRSPGLDLLRAAVPLLRDGELVTVPGARPHAQAGPRRRARPDRPFHELFAAEPSVAPRERREHVSAKSTGKRMDRRVC